MLIEPPASVEAAALKSTVSGAVPAVGVAVKDAVGAGLTLPPPLLPPPPPHAVSAAATTPSPARRKRVASRWIGLESQAKGSQHMTTGHRSEVFGFAQNITAHARLRVPLVDTCGSATINSASIRLTLQAPLPVQLRADDGLQVVEPRLPAEHLTDALGVCDQPRRIARAARLSTTFSALAAIDALHPLDHFADAVAVAVAAVERRRRAAPRR